jgi:large subunit ribosomal protein L31
MRADIHPTWYAEAEVTCLCGNTFTTASTKESLKIQVCSKCHPYFTGEQRIVDTEGRVERLKRKYGLE